MLNCRRLSLAAFIFGCFYLPFGFSQDTTTPPLPSPPPAYSATPPHMWEIGLHGGGFVNFGDIDFVPNWGAGFHVRRAIDYVFSLRGDAMYGVLKNEDDGNEDGKTETTVQSASLQLLVSLNNLLWNANKNRKTNFYFIAGGGLTHYDLEIKEVNDPTWLMPIDDVIHSHAEIGAGIAFRISPRFNLGFESKGTMLFGSNADRIDGVNREDNDIMNYTSVRLNFNIGNSEKRAEPLYWVNPMDVIMSDIAELKARPVFDLTDTDGDGVIDMIDQDPNTPPGAPVDTRGIPLDSDGDGVPNYEDDEPYISAGTKYAKEGDKPYMTEDDVKMIVGGEIERYSSTGGGLTNWFLPTIHFDLDKSRVRYADYGHLANIAKVMKSNPNIKVVVTGYTDKTASDAYNKELSYKRAKAAIEHLVNTHGIPRSRLLLNYYGEDDTLVPLKGATLMNRRVEFRVATDQDVDMEKPVPTSLRLQETRF